MRKSERVLLSILAGLQILAGAANLVDLVGGKVAAWVVLSVGVIQAAIHFWVAPESPSDRSQG